MNRIPLGRFDALMSLRPFMKRHVVPACSQHRRLLSDSPATATAPAAEDRRRRWVMLSRHGCRTNESFVANSVTVAEARTFTGRQLRVSLRCAAPPASTKLYFDLPEEEGVRYKESLNVVAAHAEVLLLEMDLHDTEDHFVYTPAGPRPSLSLLPIRDVLTTSFLKWLKSKYGRWMAMCSDSELIEDELEDGCAPYMVQPPTDITGLLRRGNNDVLVVQLHMWFKKARDREQLMAEFYVLHPGMREWNGMDPVPILHDFVGKCGYDLNKANYQILKSPKYPVSVGDRFICWVHYSTGFVLCDMDDEASPKARYVPFPAELSCCRDGNDDDEEEEDDEDEDDDEDDDDDDGRFLLSVHYSSCGHVGDDDDEGDGDSSSDDDSVVDDDDDHNHSGCDDDSDDDDYDARVGSSFWEQESMCWHDKWSDYNDDPKSARYMGAARDRNVRLVSIDPHGDSGFTINTWTINLRMDEPLAWVKDGEINSQELFELPGYEGLPRLQQENLKRTLMCFDSDNPDIIGLLVCNDYTRKDEEVWMIQLNMRTKTLLSAVQSFTNDCRRRFNHLPVQLQY